MNNRREASFFVTLCVIAAVFPFSEALLSIFIGLLLLQAIVLKSWNHPGRKERNVVNLLLVLSVFGVYLVGMSFAKDLSLAVYELKKVIFWLVVPLAFFLSPPIGEKRLKMVLWIFILSVFIGSLLFTAKYVLAHFPNSHGLRLLGIISNIRFSFQVGLSIIILAWFLFGKSESHSRRERIWMAVLLIWLIAFLFILQSLLGLIAFFATMTVAFAYASLRLKHPGKRFAALFVLIALIAVPLVYVYKVVHDFYKFDNVNPESVEHFTPSGNRYLHDFEVGDRENGHLVYIYICHDELRQEWNKRSEVGYDDLIGDYPLSITLIRYLASLGYRKDSAAVSRLSAMDIDLIRKGITNYKFGDRRVSIYPRIYETVWELDNYFRTGNPNNKSLAQRIEYVKASLILIGKNPLFGIGTGNWRVKFNEAFVEMNSSLREELRASSHNQYLNYLVKFGLVGFLYILSAVLVPVFRTKSHRNCVFVFFLIFMGFANLGDSNLESHMGLTFFSFFYSFFLWNSADYMKCSD
jgi:hypothetical protein